jgi:hypothetical protein
MFRLTVNRINNSTLKFGSVTPTMKTFNIIKKTLNMNNNSLIISRKCSTNTTSNIISSSNEKKIGYWLLCMSGLVAGMVTIGGITRLTKSGI